MFFFIMEIYYMAIRVDLNTFATAAMETFGTLQVTNKQMIKISGDYEYLIPGEIWNTDNKVSRGVYNIPAKLDETVVMKVSTAVSEVVEKVVGSVQKTVSTVVSYIPPKDPTFIKWGNYRDLETVIKSRKFYPVFITGLSGNGKTMGIRQACANLNRELIRVNFTVETDEDDLIGGFRLLNGETVWQDGPVVEAMRRGSVLLLDEIDLASHKVMTLQSVLEGQGVFLKKINEQVLPAEGFTVIATANTKGKGSDDGRFVGTNILNEAFLDRFPATLYQEYPSEPNEKKILNAVMKSLVKKVGKDEEAFVDNLVRWGYIIRKTFEDGGIDEVISTRRLVDIVKTFSIFNNKEKSIAMGTERFDDDTKASFRDLYEKIDANLDGEGTSTVEETVEAVASEECSL
jgi:cobaltochelatase CobS